MIGKMFMNFSVTLVVLLFTNLSQETFIQSDSYILEADSTSQIKGPLVSLEAGSFADTLMVLLQSLYYNNNGFPIKQQNASTTILGVNLHMQYEGFLTLLSTTVQKNSISVNNNQIELTINVPTMLVNKTYSVTSTQDPDHVSKGYVLVTVDGVTLHMLLDMTQIPYFVGGATSQSLGPSNSTIHGEGIPLAEEIQEAIQDFAVLMFSTMDLYSLYEDVHTKLSDIFNKNQLILCLSCEQPYCQCYD